MASFETEKDKGRALLKRLSEGLPSNLPFLNAERIEQMLEFLDEFTKLKSRSYDAIDVAMEASGKSHRHLRPDVNRLLVGAVFLGWNPDRLVFKEGACELYSLPPVDLPPLKGAGPETVLEPLFDEKKFSEAVFREGTRINLAELAGLLQSLNQGQDHRMPGVETQGVSAFAGAVINTVGSSNVSFNVNVGGKGNGSAGKD